MTYILVIDNKNNPIAQICGKATLDNNILMISVNPVQKTLALQIVLKLTNIRFDHGKLIIPTSHIAYASNYADNGIDKENITLIEK